MRLNPQKCVFGVGSGKFPEFMVMNHGIKTNPEKIQAIRDLRESKTLNDIQKLNGQLAVLSRFLSRGTEWLLLFLKMLHGGLINKEGDNQIEDNLG